MMDIKETITPEGYIVYSISVPLPENIKNALETGKITEEELEQYIKGILQREMMYELHTEFDRLVEEMMKGHCNGEPTGMFGLNGKAARNSK